MKTLYAFSVAAWLAGSNLLSAAVFTVTTVDDSGAGSLRQAILDANSLPGTDTINFDIPGSGVHTIVPTVALPDITDIVALNGYSQPGSSANTSATADNSIHLLRLDGQKVQAGQASGLSFAPASAFSLSAASGSSVRGLVVVRFSTGIKIKEAANITVAGNWIGLDVDGIARGNSSHGIDINSFFNDGFNNVIGGTAPADRNIISGNNNGLWIQGRSDYGLVQGNFIGTDAAGILPRGNQFAGIYLFNASNILIGGPSAAARNIVSATISAGGSGVVVQAGKNNVIQGNYIGSDVSGHYDLGNLYDGIYLVSSSSTWITNNLIVNNRANGINLSSANGNVIENNRIGTDASGSRPLGNLGAGITINGSTNRIGGLLAGQANLIQFNGVAGVAVPSGTAVRNEISGNRIFDNAGLGIDLGPSGIATNDLQDVDTGANNLQNFPVLTKAAVAFSSLTVQGSLNSRPGETYRLEFFASTDWDPEGIAEGQTFLGSSSVTTDGSGSAGFSALLATAPATNSLITATATDANGNTSEFSSSLAITSVGAASPTLAITGGGATGTTTISWPSAAWYFGLEKTDSLLPPVEWQPVTSGLVEVGAVKSLVITNGDGKQFFRLKKP